MTLRVLGRRTSGNVMKVLWTLDELELPFVQEDLGGKFGGTDTPSYRQMNPNGLIPTLVDGDAAVWESNTICRYLCRTRGPTSLYPDDPLARSEVERWMDWQLGTLSPLTSPLYRMRVRTPPGEQDPVAIETARQAVGEKMRLLNSRLAHHPFVAGEALSLADVCMGFWLHRWFALGFDRGALPHVQALYDRLRQRPAYARHIVGVPIE
jgi:glutathione S-transferase